MIKKKYLFVLSIMLIVYVLIACTSGYNHTKEHVQIQPQDYVSKVEGIHQKDNQYEKSSSLILAEELNKIIDKEKVKIIAVMDKKPFDAYIPNSVVITIDDITTMVNGIEGIIADQKQIEKVLSNAGIANDDTVIIYDNNKQLYAARLWWTMKVYGHKDVRLLNGGLDEWKRGGYKTVKKPKKPSLVKYIGNEKNEELIAYLEDIKKSFDDKEYVVLDVRSKEEYEEGHIPGAIWIEWTNALNKDGTFKTGDELRQIYESKGITPDKKSIMIQCKKALRASHTYFVLSEILGFDNAKVYDGSWLEYSKSGEPIEK